jgi:hypothetical protein
MSLQSKISQLLKEIENSRTECDGFVRLASYILTKNDITHQIKVGSLQLSENKASIPLHLWIELEDYIIDYRARMWLGNQAPHGVFKRDPSYSYSGKNAKIGKANEVLFNILNW